MLQSVCILGVKSEERRLFVKEELHESIRLDMAMNGSPQRAAEPPVATPVRSEAAAPMVPAKTSCVDTAVKTEPVTWLLSAKDVCKKSGGNRC